MANELFDTGEYRQRSTLQLSPEQLAAVIAAVGKPWVKRYGQAKLIDAEGLRRKWHEQMGSCRKLNPTRFDAVCRRLADFDALEIFYAMQAYINECQKLDWRQKNPSARLSFERFLEHDRFEVYVELGKQLAKRKSQRSNLKSSETTQRMVELGHWKTLDDNQRHRHLSRARKMLRHTGDDDARVISLAQRYALEYAEGSG